MRAQLVPLDNGVPIEIIKDLIVVGRKEDCDLCLNHKSVSKMHCVLVKTDGLLLVRDLGSTNGTRVNGQRIRRAALLPNDQLQIAKYRFRVLLIPDDPGAVTGGDATQQLDAVDMAEVLQAAQQPSSGSRAKAPVAIRPNALPDIYPEDRPGERKI